MECQNSSIYRFEVDFERHRILLARHRRKLKLRIGRLESDSVSTSMSHIKWDIHFIRHVYFCEIFNIQICRLNAKCQVEFRFDCRLWANPKNTLWHFKTSMPTALQEFPYREGGIGDLALISSLIDCFINPCWQLDWLNTLILFDFVAFSLCVQEARWLTPCCVGINFLLEII